MFHNLNTENVWDTQKAFDHLQSLQLADTKRTAERLLHRLGIIGPSLCIDDVCDEYDQKANKIVLDWVIKKCRQQRKLVLYVYLHTLTNGQLTIQAHDARGARYWLPLNFYHQPTDLSAQDTSIALKKIRAHFDKDIFLIPHGSIVKQFRELKSSGDIEWCMNAYPPRLELIDYTTQKIKLTPHLARLEAESIFIIREAIAESENPVMLYSLGKDSSVMLHLAKKAFYPSPLPFPLLHVDTRWKFQEMYLFREYISKTCGTDLLVHINPEAIEKNINPFEHGSALHTDITKTQGLKQALDHYKFDLIFGGARRDEEKSRAKERIFSFRNKNHTWDPKNQRPEVWNLYNTRIKPGESIRVFPLSNWTELDIWQYIYHEQIPVVPLYFAKERPVINRDGTLFMIDDSRFELLPGEILEEKIVRFRTLGCYPLTGAVESKAKDVSEIIIELMSARQSERQGRKIDTDSSASMEKKKREGYF